MLGRVIGGDAEWPGIISKTDGLAVRRIVAPRSETVVAVDGTVRKRWSAVAPKTLLRGVIHCATGRRGGTAMVGWTRVTSACFPRERAIRKKHRAYRCLECCAVISGDKTDEWVASRVIIRLDHQARARRAKPAGHHAPLTAQLNALEGRRAEIIEDARQGILTRKDRNDLLVGVNCDIEAVEAALAASRHQAARHMWASGDLAVRWGSLTFDQRRAVVAAAVERVESRRLPDDDPRPRNRFRPERISISGDPRPTGGAAGKAAQARGELWSREGEGAGWVAPVVRT
jgi:hypothetical protein